MCNKPAYECYFGGGVCGPSYISIVLLSPRQNKLWTQHVEIIHEAIEHLGKTDYDFRQNHEAKEESKLDSMKNDEELSSLKTESDYSNTLPTPFTSYFKESHHSYER